MIFLYNKFMLVSVIITSYNYQQYIKDTINSVKNQTFKDWELIVIDDASTDSSVEIIKETAQNDSRIKLIVNSENLGLKKSIQKALENAAGEWIAFLESDDLWQENYLEEKVKLSSGTTKAYGAFPLQSPLKTGGHFGLIFNDVELFGDGAAKKFKKPSGKFSRNMFYEFGIRNPVLTMSCVMVKKNLLELIDFDTPIDKLLDWYIYIQLARLTDFYYIPEKLTKWRRHSESYLGRNKNCKFKFANIAAYLKILKNEPFNIHLLVFIILATIGMCIKRFTFYTGETCKVFKR